MIKRFEYSVLWFFFSINELNLDSLYLISCDNFWKMSLINVIKMYECKQKIYVSIHENIIKPLILPKLNLVWSFGSILITSLIS